MHLRGIKVRGFKSFPEPLELRFEPGVSVVVGPNGSGKSNISDAIVWAAGSLSPTELRAEKPDDVLFAGGGGRAPAEWCEVELLFDNVDGRLEELDYSEISITRRLHRGGEGQYLVNRSPVRRTDLVELLADIGLGGAMHSIIGQGRVEAVLSSKPEERRLLIEEAAGLGKFKRRRHRAELKLARVATEVERARDLEREVKGRLRPLALQATAAERAEKLVGEIAGLRARIATLDLEACSERLDAAGERRTAAALARRLTTERLEALLADREGAEEELGDAAGKREASTAALYRLRSGLERLILRRESAGTHVERLAGALAEARQQAMPGEGPTPAELERDAAETAAAGRAAAAEYAALDDQAALGRERLAALERSLAEREGLPPAARALAETGERLALDGVRAEPGRERATAAALRWRASALVAASPEDAFVLLERAREGGLGDVTVLVRDGADEVVRSTPVVSKEELLAATEASVTPEGHGYDPVRGELWYAGETAEAVLLELEARRAALAAEIETLAVGAASASERAQATAETARRAAAAFARVAGARPVADPVALERLLGLAQRLAAALAEAGDIGARLEPALRARVDAGSHRAGELGGRLRELGAAEAELRREAGEAAERSAAVDVEIARIEAEADEARRRLEEADAEPAEGDDRDVLAERVERLDRRREQLGAVNPFAKEEYEREKERLDELAAQRADLETSLDELAKLRDDLNETVERRFAETFDAVSEHFGVVAGTLFPGGEGRLFLTEADEEGGEPGIEVELRPAGKRITRLSLLSGGEKSLGAIAFLFSLFLARPCPFYLLDEVEAALDDTNIGRFVELLRRYSEQAQFIVVTHQKRTMEAADILYGVTMGDDGISQVVSRRLPQQETAAVSAA